MSSIEFWSRARVNESKRCNVDNCFYQRHKVSGYCKKHERNKERYGHPLGHALLKREYRAEQDDIRAFIEKYSDHPAITAGIAWFNDWMKAVSEGRQITGVREMRQLVYEGVDGKACLQAVLSIWLYSHRRYSRLPDDMRLTFALAVALFRLASKAKVKTYGKRGEPKFYYRGISHRVKRDVGKLIRETFAVVAGNVFAAVDRDMQEEEEIRKSMRKGF